MELLPEVGDFYDIHPELIPIHGGAGSAAKCRYCGRDVIGIYKTDLSEDVCRACLIEEDLMRENFLKKDIE